MLLTAGQEGVSLRLMAGLSKLLGVLPIPFKGNTKAVVAFASLGAGVLFYLNRRVYHARYVGGGCGMTLGAH